MMDEYTRTLIQEIADDVSEVRRVVLRGDARSGKLEAVANAARLLCHGPDGECHHDERLVALADVLDTLDKEG